MIFIWTILYIVLIGMAMSFVLASGKMDTTAMRDSAFRVDALHEARGGIRWAKARLANGTAIEPWTRENPEGKLEVRIEGDTITSIFTLKCTGRPVRCRVTAQWRRADPIELFNWREE